MNIGLIQHNPTTGDFPRNVRSLVDGYRECLEAGADIVFSPALALPGTGCRDLMKLSRFGLQLSNALTCLAQEVMYVPLCVGTFVENSRGEWEEAYAFLQSGKVREIIPYTHNGKAEPTLLETPDLGILLLPDNVTCNLETNADLVLYLSSSRWHLGAEQTRLARITELALSLGIPVMYCGSTGANDSQLYNGQSCIANPEGDVAGLLGAFEEGTLLYDMKSGAASLQKPLLSDNEILYGALVTSIRDYCTKTGISSLCLGLSGGIDSALVAVLATEALGPENVLGVAMPSPYSSEGSITDALALASNLGIKFHLVPISSTFLEIKASLASLFEGLPEDVTEENLQSRIRGMFLMAAANKFGHMLLSTGNKSEAAVGYCTLYGDTCGGLAPIADLYKRQVYALSEWINRNGEIIPASTIYKAPSAELCHNQKDEDTLPPYSLLDKILELLIEKDLSATDIIQDYGFDETTVRWIQRRIFHNEWKRRQGAIVPLVSQRGFGPPRDFPVVHQFRD